MNRSPKRTLLLVAFAVFLAARLPAAFWQGRLWAEEGMIFYRNPWVEPWWDALTDVHTSYMNLIANVSGLIAWVFPPEQAPHVTILISLGFQVIPGLLLATSRLPWLNNWRFALALLIVATPPVTEEVWLNTITSQYWLMLSAALILMLDPPHGRLRYFYYAVLALAPLTGPGGIIVAPFFVLRCYLDWSEARFYQAVIICLASLIEGVILVTHMSPKRFHDMSLPLLVCVFYVKHIVLPFMGTQGKAHSEVIRQTVLHGHYPIRALVLPILAFSGLTWAVLRSRRMELRWALAVGITISVLGSFAAIGGKPTDLLTYFIGNRYYYASAVLFGLCLLGLTQRFTLAWIPVIWIIVVGLWSYFDVRPEMQSGPDWQQQIAEWRQKHGAFQLRAWGPGPYWGFTLPYAGPLTSRGGAP